MTQEELDEVLSDCPTLYHMAEQGSWPSIQDRGLLSTTALLDLYEVKGETRARIEAQRRPTGMPLVHPELPRVVIRDQIPMDDNGLRRCLPRHISPSDWYRLLNTRVFFWLTRERLLRLLDARAYRTSAHDVIEADAPSLVAAYREKIWFCPMNSGCTKPIPHPRGDDTFFRISNYPYSTRRKNRRRGERVVEVAVDYGIPDIRNFVVRVLEMQGDREIRTIYEA